MNDNSEKSIVSMEQNQCPVCGKTFDTGALLLQTRNIDRPKLGRNTFTGLSLCPDCDQYRVEYLTLVGVDESKSQKNEFGKYTPETAYRTGEIARVRREAAQFIFQGIDKELIRTLPFMYADDRTIKALMKMAEQANL